MAVSTNSPIVVPDRVVKTVYPTIAATGLGRMIGSLCGLIPPISNVSPAALIFGLPLAPLAATIYLLQKAVGSRYVIATDSVKIWSAMGHSLQGQVALADVADVEIDVRSGQAFMQSGDLKLVNADGDTLLRLKGVPRPEVLRHTILEVRDATDQVQSALATIEARQPA